MRSSSLLSTCGGGVPFLGLKRGGCLVGLTDQAEVGRLELAGAQPPEVDRKPARDRDDGFLSGRPGGERALGQDPAPF